MIELATNNLAALPADRGHEYFGLTATASVFNRCLLIMSLAVLGRFAEATAYEAEAIRRGFLQPGEAVHPAFRERLRELGYLEGQNITVEERHGGGGPEKAPELAAELVVLKVDVIVVGSFPLARAVKQATTTIPSCRSVRILWGPD